MVSVFNISGQDAADSNLKLEVSASVNNQYKFQNIEMGCGLALGALKEKSPNIRRYLGLEINMNFNPLERYVSEYNKANMNSTSVDVKKLYLIDAVIPLFYEISIVKKRHHLFFNLGGYFSVPLGGKVEGVSSEMATDVNQSVQNRINLGGIGGLGMRLSNGERNYLTVRMDTRMDLMFGTIGHSTPINNRYIKLSVGYTLKGV
jgi:hypothetical protein